MPAPAFQDGDAVVVGTPENGRGPLFDDGTLVGRSQLDVEV